MEKIIHMVYRYMRPALATWCSLGLVASIAHGSHLDTGGNDEAPDPNQVHIAALRYGGTGCPQGTVADLLSPDAKAFTLLFDAYVAEAGPGLSLTQGRRNCQIVVDLRFPQGWSYTIFQVDYRGYARLDSGTSGVQRTNYYFQGQAMGPALQSTFYGLMDKDYQIRDTLGVSALVWSPCGVTRALNLNTQIRVSARGSRRALMTVDSIDGALEHLYGIRWQRCR